MPTDSTPRYSLRELATLAGVTPRTIRYYIGQGLISVDATPGPGPKYSDAHLARLRLIKRLQREHQPLADIRKRLADVSDADVLALSAADEPAPPTDSALDYIHRLIAPTESRSPTPPPAASAAMPRMVPPPRFSRSEPRQAPSRALRSMSIDAFGATPDDVSTLDDVSAPTPPPDFRPQRSQWERVDLAPDVELHIRRPLSRGMAKQVDRLVTIARELFAKEQP